MDFQNRGGRGRGGGFRGRSRGRGGFRGHSHSRFQSNPDPYHAPAENDQEDNGSIEYLNRKYGSLYSPMFTKDPWREFGAGQS
ncbi:hypothetical protein INT44_003952 [Umbelopsis vinacea]|uniref:Uncharacterized protein n=1 Tax=Umbelopsis vinacea TaxID=44442 RepID=A0A8H7UQZ4_9FUNG|nr:hypothetical protein INT44_003952 [Umbelopsis vinacea]